MNNGVVVTGPISPSDVADLFSSLDSERARNLVGYRGVPVSELVRALVGRGFIVEAASYAPDIDEEIVFEGARLRLTVLPRRTRARDLARDLFKEERRALSNVLAMTSSPIIHAHWTYEFAWAAQMVQGARPVVVTAHDAPLTILRHSTDVYRAVRAIMAGVVRSRTRVLTAVSPYLAAQWRKQMLYTRPIAVVPNIAPDVSKMKRSPITARVLEVADAGSLKNVASLVKAFAFIRRERPSASLQLIGPGLGGLDEFCRRLRETVSVEGVEFVGRVNRTALAVSLHHASIFAHASLEECCPVSVLEAMAAGVPVVAGATAGGTPWVLGDAGILVDVRNPTAIAEAMVRLMDDAPLADDIARRAKLRAQTRFSADAVTQAYLDIYCRALAAKG